MFIVFQLYTINEHLSSPFGFLALSHLRFSSPFYIIPNKFRSVFTFSGFCAIMYIVWPGVIAPHLSFAVPRKFLPKFPMRRHFWVRYAGLLDIRYNLRRNACFLAGATRTAGVLKRRDKPIWFRHHVFCLNLREQNERLYVSVFIVGAGVLYSGNCRKLAYIKQSRRMSSVLMFGRTSSRAIQQLLHQQLSKIEALHIYCTGFRWKANTWYKSLSLIDFVPLHDKNGFAKTIFWNQTPKRICKA